MTLLAQQYRTGALNDPVKSDPLPVGVYWADVIDRTPDDANIITFRDWLTLHQSTVTVLNETEHNASGDWNIFENDPHRLWVLFEVTSPTSWDGQHLGIGWPNEGHRDMQEGDTIDSPDPPCVGLDCLNEDTPAWVNYAVGGAVIVGGLLVILAVRR